jgi:hypothetical protein
MEKCLTVLEEGKQALTRQLTKKQERFFVEEAARFLGETWNLGVSSQAVRPLLPTGKFANGHCRGSRRWREQLTGET